MAMLQLHDVRKSFGAFEVIKGAPRRSAARLIVMIKPIRSVTSGRAT